MTALFTAKSNLETAIRDFRREGDKRMKKGGYRAEAKRALAALLVAKKAYKAQGGMGVQCFDCALPGQHKAIIELSWDVKAVGWARLKEENPRKKNTDVKAAVWSGFDEDFFQYAGAYKGYSGSTLICNIKSYGVVSKCGGILGFIVDDKKGSLAAPKGYRWELLGDAIALVKNSTGDEYHISGEDLLLTPREIAKKLRANAYLRKAAQALSRERAALNSKDEKDKKNKIIKILKAAGVNKLSIKHSFSVGNCKAGTHLFLSRLGFNDVANMGEVGADLLKDRFEKQCDRLPKMEIDRFLLALLHYQRSI